MKKMKVNNAGLNFKAIDTRTKLKCDENTPINIFSIVEQIGNLTIVFSKLVDEISGMCIRTYDKSNVIIAINTNMTLGRKRFTLAHELYHYYYGAPDVNNICESNLISKDEEENEANIFASYLLAPDYALRVFIRDECNDQVNIDSILKIENYFGMSRRAILVRLIRDDYISSADYDKYSKDVLYTAKIKGYSLEMYDKDIKSKPTTIGKYISLADKLLEQSLISDSKYRKILLDGYRDDIVCPENVNELDDVFD